MNHSPILAAVSSALLAACSPTLEPDGTDAAVPDGSGAFRHDGSPDTQVTTVVDATDESTIHRLDLDTGLEVGVDEGWELGFSRFRVTINGGLGGPGGVRVAQLEDVAFDDVTRAPADGWTVPGPDGDGDDDDEPDDVFNDGVDDWYEYDPETHTLTARDLVYAVASTEGRFFKLQLLDYYDDAGSPAWVRFRWAAIAPPETALPDAGPGGFDAGAPVDAGGPEIPPGAVTVDASDADAWVYLSATDGEVTPPAPESDPGWDLALRRTELRTNSGTSGLGLGGAREAPAPYDAIEDATTFGYVADTLVDSGRPGVEPSSLSPALADWYDYDPTTHTVTPGERAYLVRTATGGYARLRIWSWDDGRYTLSFEPLERRVQVRALDVDASDAEAWVYLSLRDGALVEVTDAATDGAWDVGLSRTRMRTNGGTSGASMGAAVETDAADVMALGAAPTEGFVEDSMLSAGAPGSPEYSGNAALGAWFDYDPATHAITPRPVVFIVRTADGQLGALRVRSWADGTVGLEVAFAGPNQSSFF